MKKYFALLLILALGTYLNWLFKPLPFTIGQETYVVASILEQDKDHQVMLEHPEYCIRLTVTEPGKFKVGQKVSARFGWPNLPN